MCENVDCSSHDEVSDDFVLFVPNHLLALELLQVSEVVDEHILFHDVILTRLVRPLLQPIDFDVFAVGLAVSVADSVAGDPALLYAGVADVLDGGAQNAPFLVHSVHAIALHSGLELGPESRNKVMITGAAPSLPKGDLLR